MTASGGTSLSIDKGVATVWFDRARSRNAMLFATWAELPSRISQAEANSSVAAIVLRGAGGNFGAGNDISEFGALSSDLARCRAYGQAMADAMLAVEKSTKPVIAAVEGNCFGASVALALSADFRIAATDARFAITPAKLGALYLRSDLHRLVRAVGQGQARRMIFTAAAVDALEAAAMGLVEKVAAPEHFAQELDQLLGSIKRGSPYTLVHSKRMLNGLVGSDTPMEDDESLGWFVAALQGADFAEGYAAFMEKRPPQFVR